jgi:S-adenosylmethionine:tRNA ribosyltransferase-isomerase
MRRSDFHYELPEELIAQAPLPERSASRLLLLEPATGVISDCHMPELPGLLEPGDLLVFNDTRVLPARLLGHKPSGGRVELLLERAVGECRALVQLRASKGARIGQIVRTPGGDLTVRARHADLWEIETPIPVHAFFEQHGAIPLPPYIRRAPTAEDRERYQSLLARAPGAVAAPTASLHFDEPLFAALAQRGLGRALVTLHVGAGTFQPLRTEDLEAHVMHSERYEVGAATVAAIAETQAAGGRVVAVGTTVARALESAARDGTLRPGSGDTALFIRPGYRFNVVDALLTNFHLPESTLLMLVAALAGLEPMRAAYAHAVRQRYRFFSYGDAMLVLAKARSRS